jgi:hypothetical protein
LTALSGAPAAHCRLLAGAPGLRLLVPAPTLGLRSSTSTRAVLELPVEHLHRPTN